ncbi:hypothetical protein [Streptomyces sp. V4I2]|uniref:hypothetical protein n=1 Tax=Streptomyces sp. V4I2 TaxID=3042280 RepID=UPI0027D8A30F|nr:hypothetical protein [Streptomyces sp. V4I2]
MRVTCPASHCAGAPPPRSRIRSRPRGPPYWAASVTELPEEPADRIEAWAEGQGLFYQYDLGVAPGCKVADHTP